MTLYPRLVTLGTANSTTIEVDATYIDAGAQPVTVTLTADFVLNWPSPPGWVVDPSFQGSGKFEVGTLTAGRTLTLLPGLAAALVTAGAASYA